jgi:hypothetical protein
LVKEYVKIDKKSGLAIGEERKSSTETVYRESPVGGKGITTTVTKIILELPG